MFMTEERILAVLTPMWTRIARGEIDLSRYTDDEILTAQIRTADGRLLPPPASLPDRFIAEQVRRGMRKAQRRIREGAMKALDVYEDIMDDDLVEPKDRLKAGQFFLDRFLGKETQHVHVTTDVSDAREELVRRLVAARAQMSVTDALALAAGDVCEGEIVEEAIITLEDLL